MQVKQRYHYQDCLEKELAGFAKYYQALVDDCIPADALPPQEYLKHAMIAYLEARKIEDEKDPFSHLKVWE